MTLLRANPQEIDTSLKEAVADSFLNILYARISGGGDFGRTVYGAKPSSCLVSGFLLPRRAVDDGDEVTSPIWISGHGLDFQVAKDGQSIIRVAPRLSVYVRVFPTERDLRERDDCRFQLRMRHEVATRFRKAIKDALNAAWEPLSAQYKTRFACPMWKQIQDEVQDRVRKEFGLPPMLPLVPRPVTEAALENAQSAAEVPDGEEMPEIVRPTEEQIPQLRDEDFEPLEVPLKWFRLDVALPALELNVRAPGAEREQALAAHETAMEAAIHAHLRAWLEDTDPETGGKLWAYRQQTRILPSAFQDWPKCLAKIRASSAPPAVPMFKVRWDIEVTPDWIEPSRLNVHLALENQSEIPSRNSDEVEPAFFQVGLEVTVPKAEHRRLKLERVNPSYRYNQHLSYGAIGYNGGVQEQAHTENEVRLATTWSPRYQQPRIVPSSYPGVVRNIRAQSKPEGLSGLTPIPDAFAAWLEELPKQVNLETGIEGDAQAIAREQGQFQHDLARWKLEESAIRAGLTILQESSKFWKKRGKQEDVRAAPFEAWLAMNEAMANLMKLRLRDDSAQWRLFQMAFILANLPATTTRIPEFAHHYVATRDDAVTLLYFPTGGGKSEAFFGLLLFTLFLDRLRGKGLGVTAMIRYPLRLLTIQQAQRAARVLAQAELVRLDQGYGGQPFSIGFWVGSGGSPNWHSSKGVTDVPVIDSVSQTEDELRDSDANYDAANKAWNKLPFCPFCGSQTGLRRFPSRGGTLAHICTNPACRCNAGGTAPLPFYICDEDIYDLAPSVLLGTVDKLALIGYSARTIRCILGMLGTAPWYQASTGRLHVPSWQDLRNGPSRDGYVELFPAYKDGRMLFFDPFPSLIVQDEAHLLDESLGTFAGLFESTLDAMLGSIGRWMRGIVASTPDGSQRRRAKVIAASATVSEPERQLEHLYQRHVPALQFPYPGPSLHRSFYAQPEEPSPDETTRCALDPDHVELRSRLARIYCGFMTNGRPHTATTIAVLANFHLTVTALFDALTADDPERQQAARTQLATHVSPSPIQAELVAKLRQAPVEQLATLIDLHRISLTYVTNKKGGDQIMAAESEEVRKLHKANGWILDALVTRLITGSVEQGEIQQTVETAQRRVSPGTPMPPLQDALRSIIATSAVSHGVDVEELNSMFFAGMPSDIAEYIQASSRVGRTHVGFCVLIPTPQRRRDRYIVEVFDVFHRFLERMVQPAAIDRWATRAIMRVLPSVFQACVCGTAAVREFIRADDGKKPEWKPNEYIRDFLPAFKQDPKQFISQVADFVYLAIGLKDGFAPQAEEFYRAELYAKLRHLLEDMARQQNENSSLADFFRQFSDTLQKPMTSLRDVDQAGTIRLARRGPRGERLPTDVVREVMAFVRRGYAESGDEE
ncbi:helicase-related protein [Rhodocyclus purpureus]|uniref:helicase-related protein n=1 Tax=Rhodocyclus purpureus TaxID=1067 RepID=UPI0019126A77|nr:helicase-related protein [Rhodocyclus purpureus]